MKLPNAMVSILEKLVSPLLPQVRRYYIFMEVDYAFFQLLLQTDLDNSCISAILKFVDAYKKEIENNGFLNNFLTNFLRRNGLMENPLPAS